MTKIKEFLYKERLQYLVFIGLSIGVAGLTGIGYFSNHLLFQRFLGRINPFVAILFIIFLGVVLLSFLLSRGWFAIFRKKNLKGLLRRSGLAALFALAAILVDLKVVLPAGMNIVFPVSLAFYPVMGFIVEIFFHVLPLSLILLIQILLSGDKSQSKLFWGIGIFMVSLLEPILQVMAGYSRPVPSWILVWTGMHVFFINLTQLIIFKRHDFVSMYSFRLVYYLIWHIIWGVVRLRVLF